MCLISVLVLSGCDLPAIAPTATTSPTGAGIRDAEGLCVEVRAADSRRPSLVSLLLDVETCRDDEPVSDLTIDAFRLFEDGQPISVFESRAALFPVEGTFELVNVLLVDLSFSITQSEDGAGLEALKAAVLEYLRLMTMVDEEREAYPSVAIYWFDGSRTLGEIVGFTSDVAELTAAVNRLDASFTRDDSTNLYGAVVEGIDVLERESARLRTSGTDAVLSSLVLFTDGSDRARLVEEGAAINRVERADTNFLLLTIGVGGEIDAESLAAIGRNGFEFARDSSEINAAFARAAARVRSEANSVYLVRYCSPRRAGSGVLRVEVSRGAQGGHVERAFRAATFGPGCDPNDPSGDVIERLSTASVRTDPAAPPPTVLPPVPELASTPPGASTTARPLRLVNDCALEIRFAMRYVGADGQWATTYWHLAAANSDLLLSDGFAPLRLGSRDIDYFAETTGQEAGWIWDSPLDTGRLAPFEDRFGNSVAYRSFTVGLSESRSEYVLSLDCP